VNKKTLFLTLLGALILPIAASAQTTATIGTAVQKAAVDVGGPLVVAGWIIAGILYLTAAGSPERMGIAKKALVAAVIGTILVILAAGAQGFVKNLFGI
jgi:hypothetical protein